MKKNQNRLEAIRKNEELSKVFIGTETVIFLSGRFLKIVSAVSIQKSIQTPYIKKRKSSGFIQTLMTKKARLYLIIELYIVHPQGFEPRTFLARLCSTPEIGRAHV